VSGQSRLDQVMFIALGLLLAAAADDDDDDNDNDG